MIQSDFGLKETEKTNHIQLQFRQAADPWHDWGICEIRNILEDAKLRPEYRGLLEISEADINGFDVTAHMSKDEFVQMVHKVMVSSPRWNLLYPRFEEGKKIPNCNPSIDKNTGRRIPNSKDKNDAKWVKQNWEAYGCKGHPPKLPRNKCQRIANVPLTPMVLESLLKSEGGAKSIEEIIHSALNGETTNLKQETNLLTANHHSNGKVRGPHASNSSRIESGLYVFACYAASLSPWKPFVFNTKKSNCTVYLPDNVPFDRAWRLWEHLHSTALHHPDTENGMMYRNIPLAGDGEAAQLLMLLDALQSTLPVKRSADDLDMDDIPEFNNWLAISFSSSTGVSVGSMHRIEIPGAVFKLLEPIAPPAKWTNIAQVAFVHECLAGIRISDATPQDYFAQALLDPSPTGCWHKLEKAAFFLYKNSSRANTTNRRSAALLPHFISHFAKEIQIMQEELFDACRKIGQMAGQAFSRDVTMISRLHNTSSPDELRANLALMAFRLFKMSTNDDDARQLHRTKLEQFDRVLEMTGNGEWAKAAQTISLFACLSAFNANIKNEKDGGKTAEGSN